MPLSDVSDDCSKTATDPIQAVLGVPNIVFCLFFCGSSKIRSSVLVVHDTLGLKLRPSFDILLRHLVGTVVFFSMLLII